MILGIISIIAGVLLVKFRKTVLKDNYSWQKESFGLKFGKQQFRVDEAICCVVGAVLVAGGILLVSGVIDVR